MDKKKLLLDSVFSETKEELINLAEIDEGATACLDILNKLPFHLQPEFIRELATTHNPKLINFFNLVARETTGSLKKAAERALLKMSFLGYKIDSQPLNYCMQGMQVFASSTRLQGACMLMFINEKDNGLYEAHYFQLKFNHLGIADYFYQSVSSKKELLIVVKNEGLVPLNFCEGQRLLLDAYNQNLRFKTKVATGFSKYKYILKINNDCQKNIDCKKIIEKVREKVTDKKIVNAYLLALKNMDASLAYDLSTEKLQKNFQKRERFLENWHHPFKECRLLKSFISANHYENKYAYFSVKLVFSDESDCLKAAYLKICLQEIKEHYYIDHVEIEKIELIDASGEENPLNYNIYAVIYKVNDIQIIKDVFERNNDIDLVGEREEADCYKWFKNINPLEKGIDFLQNIYGEFILTKDELIVYAPSLKNLSEITIYLQKNIPAANLMFQNKAMCNIRDIYSVLISGEKFSLNSVFTEQESYLIPQDTLSKWRDFCIRKATEKYKIDEEIEVFNLSYQGKPIEVIFFEKTAQINIFSDNLQKIREGLNLPQENVYKIRNLFKNAGQEDRWHRLKIIRVLKQDKLTRHYIQSDSVSYMANKFRLIYFS